MVLNRSNQHILVYNDYEKLAELADVKLGACQDYFHMYLCFHD